MTNAVTLTPETQQAIDQQADHFTDNLLTEDPRSPPFKAHVAQAFALGREEIAHAAHVMQTRVAHRHLAGVDDASAQAALAGLREQLEALNPGEEGDLLQPRKLLGFIPVGSRLDAYFRRYAQALPQMQALLSQLYAAQDDLQRDVLEIEATRTKLWDAMHKLTGAARFARVVDERLATRAQALEGTDPLRAKALHDQVLLPVRQNLVDIQTQQAVCMNGYLALEVLLQTSRELVNGCSRVAEAGLSALAVAQGVAQATGHQARLVEMASGVNAAVGELLAQAGRQLGQDGPAANQYTREPRLGIARLKQMFDQAFLALDAMDNFHAQATDTLARPQALLQLPPRDDPGAQPAAAPGAAPPA
jgi:uncharacterized protein YaaN involved in tellurite resistance